MELEEDEHDGAPVSFFHIRFAAVATNSLPSIDLAEPTPEEVEYVEEAEEVEGDIDMDAEDWEVEVEM
jgi:hypothetical protein